MGKSTRLASMLTVVAFAIALAYTALYVTQRLYVFGDGSWQGILLVVVWALVVAALLYGLILRSRQREELLRRYYLSSEWIYNHEIGYAPVSQVSPDGDAYEFVGFAAEALAEMSYGFDIVEPPADFVPDVVVTSRRFKYHRTGDGIVIDQWRGDVQRVDASVAGRRTFVSLGSYKNARELARLLADYDVFTR